MGTRTILRYLVRLAFVVELPLILVPISIDDFQLRDVNPPLLTSSRVSAPLTYIERVFTLSRTCPRGRVTNATHACLHALHAKLLAKHGYL